MRADSAMAMTLVTVRIPHLCRRNWNRPVTQSYPGSFRTLFGRSRSGFDSRITSAWVASGDFGSQYSWVLGPHRDLMFRA